MLTPLTAHSLSGLSGITHGFFTRDGGVSGGIYGSLNCGHGSRDATEAVTENRSRVCRHLGAEPGQILTLFQVHSASAIIADAPIAKDKLPKADAIVTRTPGFVIGALAADCAPVLFADPLAKVVAAAHAGWRGAVGGVLEATLKAMEALGADRQRIRACVGPCIGQAAYEVGPEFEAEFIERDVGNARFFVRPAVGSKPHFDLSGYVAARLKQAGTGTVEQQSPCTFSADSKLFSYRRSQKLGEGDYGRQISAIVVT